MSAEQERLAGDYRERLKSLERQREDNCRDKRALESSKRELEEYLAWSKRWEVRCAETAPADAHTRRLLEEACSSAKEARRQAMSLTEEALDSNRKQRHRLELAQGQLLDERRRAVAEAEAGEGQGRDNPL